jgi:phosphoenolpyruvate carboxylase
MGVCHQVTGQKALLASNVALKRLIDMRNPYIDPINVLQVGLRVGRRSCNTCYSVQLN